MPSRSCIYISTLHILTAISRAITGRSVHAATVALGRCTHRRIYVFLLILDPSFRPLEEGYTGTPPERENDGNTVIGRFAWMMARDWTWGQGKGRATLCLENAIIVSKTCQAPCATTHAAQSFISGLKPGAWVYHCVRPCILSLKDCASFLHFITSILTPCPIVAVAHIQRR
jgi:hypothetical protein